jgi:hypothetical protein
MIGRRIFAAALVATVAALAAPVALADGPVRIVPEFPPFTGSFCPGFDVRVEAEFPGRSLLTFDDGSVMIVGHFEQTVTNVETGRSIVLNSSGADVIDLDPLVITHSGRSAIFIPAGRPLPQQATLFVGHNVIVPRVSITYVGQAIDLCALLA